MDIADALSNIGFDWKVALANLVNFLIVFFLLKRFVWRPIQAKLDERKEAIKKGLDNAEFAEKERKAAEEKYKEVVSKANRERNEIVKSAWEKEGEIVAAAKGKAEKEAESLLKNAHNKAGVLLEEAREKFRKESITLVVEGARKLLKEEIDEKKGEEIIKGITKRA